MSVVGGERRWGAVAVKSLTGAQHGVRHSAARRTARRGTARRAWQVEADRRPIFWRARAPLPASTRVQVTLRWFVSCSRVSTRQTRRMLSTVLPAQAARGILYSVSVGSRCAFGALRQAARVTVFVLISPWGSWSWSSVGAAHLYVCNVITRVSCGSRRAHASRAPSRERHA